MLRNDAKRMLKVFVFQIKLLCFMRAEGGGHTVKTLWSVTYNGKNP